MNEIGFVKFPPEQAEIGVDNINIPIITERDLMEQLDNETFASLIFATRNVLDSKEGVPPLYALDSFILSVEAGVYPSPKILEWLTKVFREFRYVRGTERLEKLLGIRRGPGRGSLLTKREAEKERDEQICWHIHILNKHFKMSLDQAAGIIHQHMQDQKRWDRTGLNLTLPAPRTMKKYYTRDYRDAFNELDKYDKQPWTDERKEEYLNQFKDIAKKLINRNLKK